MTRRKTIKWAVTGAVVLAVGGRWWMGAREPVIHIPTRALPTPNAYDVYVRATKQLVRDNEVGNALSSSDKPSKLSDAQKADLVRDNAAALATLRSGLPLEYGEPPVRSFSALFPHLAMYRSLSRLLVVEGNTRRAAGDMHGAVSSYLDTVEFGGKVANGGPLIHSLVSLACQAIGRKPLWENLDLLDAATAKAATRRMETISSQHVPFAQTLQEEKYVMQSSMVSVFRDSSQWQQALIGSQKNTSGPEAALQMVVANGMYLIWGKQTIIDNNARFMDALAVQASRPYAERKPIALPSDILNQILLPVFIPAQLKDVASETQNALLTVSFSLRAYANDHRKQKTDGSPYPKTLNELVTGGYLQRMPVDPFSVDGKASLRYYRTEYSYTLYSVGPDGKDDAGTAINNRNERNEASRRLTQKDSKGDIVAGINKG